MAKKNKSKKVKQVQREEPEEQDEEMMPETETGDVGNSLTLAEIDAISDEDDDEVDEWNAEAKALRQAIEDGAFNKLKSLTPFTDGEKNAEKPEDGDEDVEQDGDDSVSDQEQEDGDEGAEEEEKEEDNSPKIDPTQAHIKALKSVTSELVHDKATLPWQERLDNIPQTPLPFGQVTEDGLVIDVHDDLKREVAFYNLALESVYTMRSKCENNKIQFSRPEDFFAEMVKTDDHMAMVKDRLIFENKKMEAFEQRKSNREQKLRAKEKHAHRLAEKAKHKKQHLDDVQDWAKSAANNRVGGGRVRDDDDEYLNRMGGPNKKRQAADRKFGHGGKRGRFKQNDRKSMNDMSQYNPKGGNFQGGRKAGPSKRKGKRARDAAKSRG